MYKIYMIEDDEGIFEASKKHGEKYDLKFVGVNNFRRSSKNSSRYSRTLLLWI